MKNSRFNHQNRFHFALSSNTELPTVVTSDSKELDMNEFPVKSAGSGVEGTVIAPPKFGLRFGLQKTSKEENLNKKNKSQKK